MNSSLILGWRLARRELRHGLRGFRVFLACIALGVGAIAGVGNLSRAIVTGLEANGAQLLGGDIDIRLLHRPATAEQTAYLRAHGGALSEVIKMRAMARPAAIRDKRAIARIDSAGGVADEQ